VTPADGNSDDRAETATSGPARRPGHELAAAREQRGIERMAMAAKLHLPERRLDALERDDYQQLPPPAFVRGYLRAYAHELEIDSDEIVAAYDALGVDAGDPALRPIEGNRGPGGALATAGSLAVLALVVVAALAGWWWQQRDRGDAAPDGAEPVAESPADSGAGSGDADGATGDDATPAQAESSATGETEGGAGSTTQAGSDAVGSDDGAVGEPNGSGTATASADGGQDAGDGAGGTSASEATSEGADDGAATASEQPEAGAAQEARAGREGADNAQASASEYQPPSATRSAEAALAPAASEGPDTLVVEVAGRSWIEISDARDRRLVYTLYSGEARLRLRGWAPFDVFLGNSPAVRLRFAGDFVAKQAFTRSNNTARFVVDAEGARRR
jgi:cytoskeleton protein RodZ